MNKRLLLLFSMLMSIFLVACNDQATESDKTTDDKKELNMALFWLDSNIEPTEGWNGWTLTRTGVGENLVQIDENMEFKPVLAKSWEQVDDTTTVFTIREDVTFHNGNLVDANAVKASIERSLAVTDRDDVKFPIESMTADGQTLTINTITPFPTLLNNLADSVFIIVDAKAAENNEEFKYKPIATGAFKVIDFDAEKGLTLHKHETHWSGDIAVDVVNAKYIPDDATRVMALQSGDVDLATQIPAKDLTLFENNDQFVVQKGSNLRIFLLRLNMTTPYMQNLTFRQALSYGMDKGTYATKLVNGLPAKGPFNDMLPFGYKDEDLYQYNPAKANELLDQLGFVDTDGDGIRETAGKNIVLKYVFATNHGNDAKNIGAAMQDQYKEIGIGLDILQVENYADIAESGDFDLLWERWTSAPTADAAYFLEASYKTEAAGNRGHYSNAKFDAITAQFKSTLDKGQRDQLGLEGTTLLIEDVASLFMYYQEGTVVTNKKVQGVPRFISEIYYIDERVKVD